MIVFFGVPLVLVIGNLVRIKGLFSVFTLAYSFSECLDVCLFRGHCILYGCCLGFFVDGFGCLHRNSQFFRGSANTIKIDLRHRLLV